MTGGAAAVAFGTAFGVWSFLKNGKKRDQSVLEQLETRAYTYTEEEIPSGIGEFVQNQVQERYRFPNCFSAPNIPLDRLSKALKQLPSLNDHEKVIAVIKTRIAFTDDRIIWGTIGYINYQDLAEFFNAQKQLDILLSDPQQQKELSNLKKMVDILSDDNYKIDLSKMEELIAIAYAEPKLRGLVSDEIDQGKLSKLKSAVVVLINHNNRSIPQFPKLKNVLKIWYKYPELVKFFPNKVVSQLSESKYKQDLFKMEDLVTWLFNESEQNSLTKFLREISKQYASV